MKSQSVRKYGKYKEESNITNIFLAANEEALLKYGNCVKALIKSYICGLYYRGVQVPINSLIVVNIDPCDRILRSRIMWGIWVNNLTHNSISDIEKVYGYKTYILSDIISNDI